MLVVAYIAGYYCLIISRYFERDLMQEMNEVAGPLLYELVQTKYFRIIRLNIDQ